MWNCASLILFSLRWRRCFRMGNILMLCSLRMCYVILIETVFLRGRRGGGGRRIGCGCCVSSWGQLLSVSLKAYGNSRAKLKFGAVIFVGFSFLSNEHFRGFNFLYSSPWSTSVVTEIRCTDQHCRNFRISPYLKIAVVLSFVSVVRLCVLMYEVVTTEYSLFVSVSRFYIVMLSSKSAHRFWSFSRPPSSIQSNGIPCCWTHCEAVFVLQFSSQVICITNILPFIIVEI